MAKKRSTQKQLQPLRMQDDLSLRLLLLEEAQTKNHAAQ